MRRSATAARRAATEAAAIDQGVAGSTGRPTVYEAALAIAARPDIHIQRVWPMRSPPTAPTEAFSSAYFLDGRPGNPTGGVLPVGGLRMSQATPFPHEPVMAHEVTGLFAAVPPGLIVDATLGGARHAAAILDAHPTLSVLGIDRDPVAVAAASARLAGYGLRAAVRQARFDGLAEVVRAYLAERTDLPGVSGVLFDLGVSSPQLDTAERGFSYRKDAPLDMRMDPTSGPTAAELVNGASEDELVELFTANGEGRFARRIARAVIAARPISTTGRLADVVRDAIPAATRRTGGHPARRVFQAVRIAVNEELDQLQTALDGALGLIRPGGRCVVIAYHSGEDRLVKAAFVEASTGGCHCPPGLPCVCGAVATYRLVHRGSRRPTPEEVDRNRRSEAARLRVVERLDDPAVSGFHPGEVA